jgi:hypothetical protein
MILKFVIIIKRMDVQTQECFTIINNNNGVLETCDNYNKSTEKNGLYIKQYIGINTNDKKGTLNYKMSMYGIDSIILKLYITLYKIGKTSFININNVHVMEIKKFLMINKMVQSNDCVMMKNINWGEIVIENCNIVMINKCIKLSEQYFNDNNKMTFMDYIEYIIT